MAKKSKKKGPPYDDDPECKYIVIEDPWPGDKIGRDRGEIFWNKLGAWIYFMLDKKYEPEVIFSMNTVRHIWCSQFTRSALNSIVPPVADGGHP